MPLSVRNFFELDHFNPIIVKELRQGNRSKAFLLNFMLAHVSMLLFVTLSLSQAAKGNMSDIQGLNVGFWTILGFFLIIGVPLVGFNAISQERAEARLDLLHLTRLSALRIVSGKWLALVSQSFLITLSIIPYVIARYYFGGVNVVTDLMVIGILLGFSALVSGLSVSLSSFKSLIMRIGMVGLLVWFSGTLAAQFASALFRGSSALSNSWEIFTVTLIQAFLFLIVALEFSASTISPLAENRQSRMRIWFLLELLFLAVLAFFGEEDVAVVVFGVGSVLGAFVLCCALMFSPVPLSSVYRPFVKRGRFGKLVGRFLLYPGYPSAVYYTYFCVSFLFLLFAFMVFRLSNRMASGHGGEFLSYLLILYPTVIGCFMVPLAFALFFRHNRFTFANRVAGSIIVLLLAGIVSSIISHNYSMDISYFFAWIPFSNLFALIGHRIEELNVFVHGVLSIFSTVVATFYVLKCGTGWRKVERELETRAEHLLVEDKNSVTKAGEA